MRKGDPPYLISPDAVRMSSPVSDLATGHRARGPLSGPANGPQQCEPLVALGEPVRPFLRLEPVQGFQPILCRKSSRRLAGTG